jgi:hypothetical protein
MASSFVPRFYRGRLSPKGEGNRYVFRGSLEAFFMGYTIFSDFMLYKEIQQPIFLKLCQKKFKYEIFTYFCPL